MENNEMLQIVLQKLEAMDTKIGAMDTKIGAMDTKIGKLDAGQKAMHKDIQTLKHDLKDVSRKVDILYGWVDRVDIKVKKIDERTA